MVSFLVLLVNRKENTTIKIAHKQTQLAFLALFCNLIKVTTSLRFSVKCQLAKSSLSATEIRQQPAPNYITLMIIMWTDHHITLSKVHFLDSEVCQALHNTLESSSYQETNCLLTFFSGDNVSIKRVDIARYPVTKR